MNESTKPVGEVRYLSPETMHKNPAYSQVIVTSGPVKTVYIGGQNALDVSGNLVGKGDMKRQTEQVLKNIEAALAAAGAKPEHVVKWTLYVLQWQSLQTGFEAFQRFWGTQTNPPIISMMFVAGLAHPDYLLEMEAIAIVPL